MFHFTSISSKNGEDFISGVSTKNEHEAIGYFEDWCIEHDFDWAHLFYQETGAGVRSYFKWRGLVDFEGCP